MFVRKGGYRNDLTTKQAFWVLDRLLREDLPRYLRQLPPESVPLAVPLAVWLETHAPITLETDLSPLVRLIQRRIYALDDKVRAPKELFNQARCDRISRAVFVQMESITSAVRRAEDLHHDTEATFSAVVWLGRFIYKDVARLVAAWDVEPPKRRYRRPSLPLLVHC